MIYDHLLVAMDFLSFTFLASAPGMILPPPWGFYWLGVVTLWIPVNLYQTLRGAYGSSVAGAVLKTFAVWTYHGLRLPYPAAGPAGLQPDAALRERGGFTTEGTEKRRKECATREALAPASTVIPGRTSRGSMIWRSAVATPGVANASSAPNGWPGQARP